MSGRIWVVEWNIATRAMPDWRVVQSFRSRADARQQQRALAVFNGRRVFGKTRLVQYVRQGGAR